MESWEGMVNGWQLRSLRWDNKLVWPLTQDRGEKKGWSGTNWYM
jgi:hypothetical protein